MNWLFKGEPANYPFEGEEHDLQRREESARPEAPPRGTERRPVFYYHTGNEKAVVGIAKALGDAYADPKDTTGRQSVVDIGR